MESQRVESQIVQKEREALKKLENVKKDHHKRLEELEAVQVRQLLTSILYSCLWFNFILE